MKKNLLVSIKLTGIMILLCAVVYPLIIAAVGTMTSGEGKGVKVTVGDKVVGYELIGQRFTDDRYFSGRPSAIDYNSAGSGGSNKGPSNPVYLEVVKSRIDSFLVHNPGVKKKDIPADLVTASSSGLDPHISPAAAYVQVTRIARIRQIEESKLNALVEKHIDHPLAGMFGPASVNVLQLNIALDAL